MSSNVQVFNKVIRFGARCIATATLALAASQANALAIINATSSLAAPESTIGFDEVALATGDSVTNQFAGLGVSFSPAITYFTNVSARPNFSGAAVIDFGGAFSIAFANDVSEAAFAFTSNSGTTQFESLLNGALVETFTTSTPLTPMSFYGFSDSLFDEIRITSASGTRAGALDNLSFSTAAEPVPAPASLLLMGIGLLGLWRVRTKR